MIALIIRCWGMFCAFSFLFTLHAEEQLWQHIIIGDSEGWDLIESKRGFFQQSQNAVISQLTLKKCATISAITSADFYLSFEKGARTSYDVFYDTALRKSEGYARVGEYAGLFHENNEVIFNVPPQSLLGPGQKRELNIEMWVYPLSIEEGSRLFYWIGSPNSIVTQRIYAQVWNSRIVWYFKNVFVDAKGKFHDYTLESNTPLVPNQWSHHMMRFKDNMIEYDMNNIPQAIEHTTNTGNESGQQYMLIVYNAGKIHIGKKWNGLMDDIIISKGDMLPDISVRYEHGQVVSKVLSLGDYGALVYRVRIVRDTTPGSFITAYYRLISERYLKDKDVILSSKWRKIPDSGIINEEGKYIQLKLDAYGQDQSESPHIMRMEIFYRSFEQLSPPEYVLAKGGDREVFLEWSSVEDERVDGYKIYFGKNARRLQGSDGITSPIDVGLRTHATVKGLTNLEGYFFAISSYHQELPAREQLSKVVFVRPH